MKNLKIKIIAVLFFCVFTPFGKIMAQTINGDDYIRPGVATSYNFSGATFDNWSSNCTGVVFSNTANLTTAVTIPKTTTCCSFTLKATYNTTATVQKVVTVLPYLQALTGTPYTPINVIYYGEAVTLTMQPVGGGTCPYPCGSPFGKNWSASSGTISGQSTGGFTPMFQSFASPNPPQENTISINAQITCSAGLVSWQLEALKLLTKLRNPTLNGPASIGCSGSPPSSVTYSVTQVAGANYYVWAYSSTQFSAIGAVNGSSITLDAIGLGAGSVSVQAFYSQGSSISSAVVSQNVQVCCIGTMAFSDVVNSGNSPYTKQAATQINTTNTITGTGSATIHAGYEVRLMAGFEAHLGSEVHIYNEGCSGVYSRMAYSDDDETADESEEIIYQYENANMASSFVTEEVVPREKFTIAPNPTTGDVTVNVFDKNSHLLFITVYNNLGSKVYEMQTIDNATHYVFSLADLINGVYTVKLTFADYTANKLLIKQND